MIRAAIIGPISRSMPMATRLATKIWAPNRASCEPPTKAWIMPDQHADQGDDRQRVGTALLHGEPEVAAAHQRPPAQEPPEGQRRLADEARPCPRPRPRTRWRRRPAVSAGRPGAGAAARRRSGTAAARRISRTAPSGRSPGCSSRPCACASSARPASGSSAGANPSRRGAPPRRRSLPPGRAARRAARISASRGGPCSITQSPASRSTSSRTVVDDRRRRCRPSPPVRAGSEPARHRSHHPRGSLPSRPPACHARKRKST